MTDAVTRIQLPATIEPATACIIGAGFWRRAIAWAIDWAIVSICVSIVLLLLAVAVPELSKVVTLRTPLDLFTTERTIESKTSPASSPSGAPVTEKIVERTVAGRWNYLFRVTETATNGRSTWTWQQIDPVTRADVKTTRLEAIVTIVLFIYLILMEGSRYQASLGKQALGLKVVDDRGHRLTIRRAAGRNLLKLLSTAILLIGFLMAGFTQRKQALHDIMARCHVVLGR